LAADVAPDNDVFDDAQFEIAHIANDRAELIAKKHSQLPEAQNNYDRASQILERLIKDHALVPHYREELSVTLCGRAAVQLALGDVPAAQRDCRTAVDQLARLIEEQNRNSGPENPEYLSLLGRVLAQESRIYLSQGRLDDSRKAFAEAIEKLDRAIAIDPARATDKLTVDRIKTDSVQSIK
jgi:tetratricopeptide (TPR) repeat protein